MLIKIFESFLVFFLIGNIFYSLSKCLENSGINIIFRVKMLLLKKVACADFNDSS